MPNLTAIRVSGICHSGRTLQRRWLRYQQSPQLDLDSVPSSARTLSTPGGDNAPYTGNNDSSALVTRAFRFVAQKRHTGTSRGRHYRGSDTCSRQTMAQCSNESSMERARRTRTVLDDFCHKIHEKNPRLTEGKKEP